MFVRHTHHLCVFEPDTGIFNSYFVSLADCLNQANDMKCTTDSVEGRTITLTCYLLIASKNVSARPPDIRRKIYWHFPVIYNCIFRIWLSHYMNNEMLNWIILRLYHWFKYQVIFWLIFMMLKQYCGYKSTLCYVCIWWPR
jgi:hypothetical protein